MNCSTQRDKSKIFTSQFYKGFEVFVGLLLHLMLTFWISTPCGAFDLFCFREMSEFGSGEY
jgi:hypothetical protein